ncbi:wax ester/triacylglycerol synthase domain-containing protein [Rhodococcoides yunnanense]|uniref:wax ester/triacylglycerol synthase domain-containing protein n=1 Tax=Rhodococcoides yunnanense TaxID=278209 RepID=UPI00093336AF|nr:wax ester/triacylglycerol synthase domain-containing protein [Rhodococcus yunnanensis]
MGGLALVDASFYYSSAHGGPQDQYLLLAFDSGDGGAPAFADIVDHVSERAPRIPALTRRLRDSPLGIEHPAWVPSDVAPKDHIVRHDLAGRSWAEFQELFGDIVTQRVDASKRPWILHVVTGVDGVPGVRGDATITILQISHAVTDGLGASRLMRALFTADAAHPTDIEGELPGHSGRRHRRVVSAAIAGAAAPYRLAQSRILSVLAVRAYRRHVRDQPDIAVQRCQPVSPTSLNGRPTEARSVSITLVPVADLRRDGFSVTSSAMTAMGLALGRYFRAKGEVVDRISTFVPIALPAATRWRSSNRTVLGAIDLHTGVSDTSERASLIDDDLRAEKRRVHHERLLDMPRAHSLSPAPITRSMIRKAVLRRAVIRSALSAGATASIDTIRGHTNIVSVNRGPADLELCGSRSVFTAGAPFLDNGRCLSHGFYGLGETIAVCLVVCPDSVSDLDTYSAMLHDALLEVGSTTREVDPSNG